MINIRKYNPHDALKTWKLFHNTIRKININHYSLEQVKAWAPDEIDSKVWRKKMSSINPFIAELKGTIVGYADLQLDGYIDHFFCHAEYQGHGVGRALMEQIFSEGKIQGTERFYSHVSITARPFFEHFGFHAAEEQQVEIRGETLTNFIMEKIERP